MNHSGLDALRLSQPIRRRTRRRCNRSAALWSRIAPCAWRWPLREGASALTCRREPNFMTKVMLAVVAKRMLVDGIAGTPQQLELGRSTIGFILRSNAMPRPRTGSS